MVPNYNEIFKTLCHSFSHLHRSLGNRFVNQFPNEKILTCKDLFAETAMRSVAYKYKDDVGAIPKALLENRGPLWLPTTFNLFSELPQFLKYYMSKETAR